MGCDGGTIPKRGELVRQKKKPEKKDKNAANMARWRHCALKHDVLKQPVVADARGRLYNKTSMIEYLLDRMRFEGGPSHVRSLKADTRVLQLTINPSFKPRENGDLGNAYLDVYSSPFICPMTGLEMNGKYKFCAIWKCGCVLSERALKSVGQGGNSCPKCGLEYSPTEDIIILNPEEEEDIRAMEERCARLAATKKVVKRKNSNEDEDEASSTKKAKSVDANNNSTASSSPSSSDEASSTTSTAPTPPSKTEVVSSFTKTSTTTKIETSKSSSASSKDPPSSSSLKKTSTSTASIQEDPRTSLLYKSLFTTSEAAKKQDLKKAHWVTYSSQHW